MYRVLPLALAIAGANAFANEQQIEHVLVSVPIHKKAAQTALSITVLSGDELRRQMSSSIGETLSKQPGLASASFGPGVGQPVIRGQQGPRTQVLQNGTASADVAALSPDHAVAVEAMLADSIEVLRGPATLLYGGGAIGGVINVIDNRIPTNRQQDVTGAIEYRHDTAADADTAVVRVDGGTGNFAFHLDGVLRDYNDLDIPGEAINEPSSDHDDGEEQSGSDGTIANTSGDSNSYTLGGSYHFGERAFAGLSVNHLESEYGIPPGAHEHEEDDDEGSEEEELVRIDMEQTRYDGAIHIHDPFAAIEVLRAFASFTDYEHVELEGDEIGTRFDRDTMETRLELVHQPVGNWHGVFGLQWRQGDFEAIGDEAYVPATDSSDLGLFLVEDYHSGDWTFELGGRLEQAERNPDSIEVATENYTTVSASTSALWSFTPQWTTSLALSRSERAPVTQELYSNVEAQNEESLVAHVATGAIEIGNTDLDTESALNADFSLAWNGDTNFAQLTLFYNDFRDYIFLSNSGQQRDGTPILSYAQEDTTFCGAEFDSNIYLGTVLNGAVTLRIFGDTVSGELDDSGDVPRLPPARLGSGLDWSKENLSIWTDVVVASDQGDPGNNELETDGYTRWDAGIDFQLFLRSQQSIDVFAKLKNIGNEEIRLSTSFLRDVAPEAGRSFEVGLRLNF